MAGFDHIRGHEQVLKVIWRIIESGRLSQAYLFSGPEGIGKLLVARSLGKMLLCSSGGVDSCGRCPSCIQVDTGTHPDLHLVAPENSTISIDNIRNLQQELSRTSFAGRHKVCIIDEAEKMNGPAQNSLLKTLEEPTPDTVLILISGQPYRLLSTIRSRCQHVTFQPLSARVAAELISEKGSVDEQTATFLALVTGGSPGKALAVDVSVMEEMRKRWVHYTRKQQGEELFLLAEEVSQDRETVDLKLNVVRLWFRDMAHYKVYGKKDRLINKDQAEEIAVQSRWWNLDDLLRIIFWIEEHSGSLEANVNPRLSLESLFLKMTPGARGLESSSSPLTVYGSPTSF